MSLKKLLNISSAFKKTAKSPFEKPVESAFKKTAKSPFWAGTTYSNKLSYDDLINAESALGRTLFGPIPEGHRREFFESKKNVWIWHESFIDGTGSLKETTIRYEVRPTGVFKKASNQGYQRIEGDELKNFRRATHSYLELVKSKLYC